MERGRLDLDDPVARFLPEFIPLSGVILVGRVLRKLVFLDRAAGLSVVALTNTALEGCSGSFPADILTAVYAAGA